MKAGKRRLKLMDKPTAFPVRVQYSEKFLTENPKVKRRQGTALRMTRGYNEVVTITWDGSKATGYVHLDFLESVIDIVNEKEVELTCQVCSKKFIGPEPKMCCSGRDCGC